LTEWTPAPGSAAALRAAFVAGHADPVSVVDTIAKRIADQDFGTSTHSPFVTTCIERARAAATASASRYQNGNPLSPLDGVPVPVKDEHHMIGLPTRGGTAYLSEPATVDSFVVRSLESAGANIPGKTHTTEWGMNPWGMSPHFDMPRNVWRDDRGAGGSSTGSAVAVGLGLAPIAIGSDGGGSIRIPASLNGLYGLKPSFIRLGRTGDIYSNSTVSHIGPLGRSTSDLVDLMTTIGATHDPDDALSTNAPTGTAVVQSWQRSLERGVRGCRIGVLDAEWAHADGAVADAGQMALAALEAEGAVLVKVEIPLASMAHPIGAMCIATEAMGSLIDDFHQHANAMGDDLRLLLNLFGRVSAKDFLNACRARAGLRTQTAAALAQVDVIALPTTRTVAPPYGLKENRTAISDDTATRNMCRHCFLGNVTGLPAGSMPVGMHEGLPIGLQILGDAWDEASVLAVMAHAERVGIASRSTSESWRDLIG
jgi:aspartyl-tRNA(Asn)/glutamyl-tRNA(Gln) amidotransferase subunit A